MRVRILADDLTGALDSGAQLATAAGRLRVRWLPLAGLESGSVALDTGTRDRPGAEAAAVVAGLASFLGGAGIAFKKIDSLLRGHVVAELAACLGSGDFARCIVAPAFPFQGRVTVAGRQHVVDPASGERGRPVGPDLLADLGRLGIRAGLVGRDATPDGRAETVLLCDAEDDNDLGALVAGARRLAGPVLWCGTGGLAGALAGRAAPRPALAEGPVLAVIGSPHPVSREQIARVAEAEPDILVRFSEGSADEAEAVNHRLDRRGRALVVPAPPAAGPGAETEERIAATLARLVRRLARPGRLIAAGGATLSTIGRAVAADSLEIEGQIMPGVPVSRVRGGTWEGVQVTSKSGAFGAPDLLRFLVDGTGGNDRP